MIFSSKMTIFYHDHPSTPTKRCRFISSVLKDAFFNCNTCKRSLSISSRGEEDDPSIYFIDEQEIVTISKARAMEAKLRRKNIHWDESYSSIFYPVTLSELFIRTGKSDEKKEDDGEMKKEEKDEFFSVASEFSCCSCANSFGSEFLSVKTSFSNCLSLKEVEIFPELRRRSIFHEFSHCEGWPFGLCKRAMLLPPLPKSPSDSWSWCKAHKICQDKKLPG